LSGAGLSKTAALLSYVFIAAVLAGVSTQPLAAQGAARAVSKSQLPPALRASLERGAAVHVTSHGTDTVAASAANVTLRPGEVVAARTGDRAVLTRAAAVPRPSPTPDSSAVPGPGGRDSVFALPFQYLGLDREHNVAMTYRPVYLYEGGLRYRPDRDLFQGSFEIALEDSSSPGVERELSRAVKIRFGGDADSIDPSSVELRRTNSQFERVNVLARTVRDSMRVDIVPTFDPRGVSLWLPVQPALAFEPPPARIQGLGVETATLVLSVRGRLPADPVTVTLSADRGSLDTNQVTLGPGGAAVARLRSSGRGPARIRAVAPGFQVAETRIEFGWPIFFLLAALSGGLVGGLATTTSRQSARKRRPLGAVLLHGVLIGLVAAVVYFGIGLNLLQFDVRVAHFNEIAVFAFAALGAMFGIPALSGTSGSKGKS
jgi:hypothetical protein